MKLSSFLNWLSFSKPTLIPKIEIPQKINHLLDSNWSALEPKGQTQMDKSLSMLRKNREFQQFPHARDVFSEHLLGTFGILSSWNYTPDITRAGLFHTGYSGDVFIFHYFNSWSTHDRQALRDVIGNQAELLVFLFGTLDRTSINQTLFSESDATLSREPIVIRSRHGPVMVTPEQQAMIMIITVADYLDQMVSVNAWRGVHQQEYPQHLYPGTGKPEIAFYWMSRVCKRVGPYLSHVPPIFNNCTQEISYHDERLARDLYWTVVTQENLNKSQKYQFLSQCIQLNPWIPEPHVLLSQLYYQDQKFGPSEQESRTALEIFFSMATCWDKRIPYRQWVGFTRLMNLRARRRLHGELSLPFNENQQNFYCGPLVSLKDLFMEM